MTSTNHLVRGGWGICERGQAVGRLVQLWSGQTYDRLELTNFDTTFSLFRTAAGGQ